MAIDNVIFYEDLENNKRYFLKKTGLVRKNDRRTKKTCTRYR